MLVSNCSEFEAVVFAPFLHDLDEVLHLWVICVLQKLNDLNQTLLVLLLRDNHLENTNCSTTLTLPELRVRVQPLEHVERLHRVVELAHFVAIVCNQIQQAQTFIARVHIDVDLPSKVWLLVHDISATQPRQVTIVCLELFALNLEQAFLSVLELSCSC